MALGGPSSCGLSSPPHLGHPHTTVCYTGPSGPFGCRHNTHGYLKAGVEIKAWRLQRYDAPGVKEGQPRYKDKYGALISLINDVEKCRNLIQDFYYPELCNSPQTRYV